MLQQLIICLKLRNVQKTFLGMYSLVLEVKSLLKSYNKLANFVDVNEIGEIGAI